MLVQSQLPPLPRELARSASTSMEAQKQQRGCPPPFGVKVDIGKRKSMEDSHYVHENFMDIPIDAGAFLEIVPSQVRRAIDAGGTGYRGLLSDWLFRNGTLLWQRARPRSARKRPNGSPDAGQDRCIPDPQMVVLHTFHLFCVFDGHGGSKASDFCAKRLHQHIRTNLGHSLTGHMHCRRFLDTKGQCNGEFLRYPDADVRSPDTQQEQAPNLEAGSCVQAHSSSNPQLVRMGNICRQEGQGSKGELPTHNHLGSQPVGSTCGVVPASCSIAVHSTMEVTSRAEDQAVGFEGVHKSVSNNPPFKPIHSKVCSSGQRLQGPSTGGDDRTMELCLLGRKSLSFAGLRRSGVSSHEICEALAESFLQTDLEFARDSSAWETGTTALVAMVSSESLCFCNCGDSRAVLYREGRALRVTRDHSPGVDDEKRRISAQGGHIIQKQNDAPRVMGRLAMTRAIGDISLRPYVIADPEVTILHHSKLDEFLVLATDGLWEVMSDKDVCTLVKKCFDRAKLRGTSPQAAAKLSASVLIRTAADRGSMDNITAIVVDLRPLQTEAGLT